MKETHGAVVDPATIGDLQVSLTSDLLPPRRWNLCFVEGHEGRGTCNRIYSSGMAFLFCVSHVLKFCNEGFRLRAKSGLRTPQKYSSKSRLN